MQLQYTLSACKLENVNIFAGPSFPNAKFVFSQHVSCKGHRVYSTRQL